MSSLNPSSRNLYPAVFFEGDPPSGNPSPTPQPQPQTPPQPKPEPTPSALERTLADLLKRNDNDSDRALRTLVGQVHALTVRAEAAEAKVGKLPDDVQSELEAYRALGKVDELSTRIQSGDSAVQERDTLKAEKVIARGAELKGYKPDVLTDLSRSKGFAIEVRGEGEQEQVFALYKDGDKDVEKPLDEYANSALAAYLPALQVETSGGGTRINPALGGGNPNNSLNKYERIRAEVKSKTDSQKPEERDLRKAGIM